MPEFCGAGADFGPLLFVRKPCNSFRISRIVPIRVFIGISSSITWSNSARGAVGVRRFDHSAASSLSDKLLTFPTFHELPTMTWRNCLPRVSYSGTTSVFASSRPRFCRPSKNCRRMCCVMGVIPP